ncbi:MAG TPA: rhodanese-like domain-containing protein [Bacteroidales bacterium]|nr:rhodanese-like domain-containing protein [Bacteroidales bacterium]HNS46873.1 rhodanese-like domain-containing protein [Bacteroidales bacterium]
MKTITAQELRRRIDSGEPLQIIDIREPTDYKVCHIPGSICIPGKHIFDHLNQIGKEIPVVIYCRYGTKGPSVVAALESDHNIRNLLLLEDGIYAWAKEIDRWMLDLI